MRILWVLQTPRFVRYFDEAIDALGAAGHHVAVAFGRTDLKAENLNALEGFAHPPQLLGRTPKRSDEYARVAPAVRGLADYVRFLDPRFADAEFLRRRAHGKAAEMLRGTWEPRAPRRLWRPALRALLRAERAIPSSAEMEAFLREQAPDVVLVSPLVNLASWEVDCVKSAARLGIPTAACIASWDNLTTKGHLRVVPDNVFVWNEAQRSEAVELHGIPSERVVVTGAQPFDRWFGRTPSTTREEFCREAGLRPDRPFLLYVGSTSNINAPDWEDAFIGRWIAALRTPGSPLRDHGVLVRPHPDRRAGWRPEALEGIDNAVVWPRERPNPVEEPARRAYFDTLHHAEAVVGVNTSAMVEAAIVGRPVFTIEARDFSQAQEGTLHFRYLLPENGGFVERAAGLDEHVAQVATVLAEPDAARARAGRFAHWFLRPQGLDEPSLPRLMAAVEALAATPEPGRAARPLRRSALRPVLRAADRRLRRPRSAKELGEAHGLLAARGRSRRKQRVGREKQERQRRKEERAQLKSRLRSLDD